MVFLLFPIPGEDDSGPNDGPAASGDEEETPKNVNIVSWSAHIYVDITFA